MEQYFRDIRIHTIHEGTTGIQGMDLLGRKVVMKNGEAMRLYIAEVEAAIQEAERIRRPQAICGPIESRTGATAECHLVQSAICIKRRSRGISCGCHTVFGFLWDHCCGMAMVDPRYRSSKRH